jgi:NO-binding membrane sensor protein with MHYT domain
LLTVNNFSYGLLTPVLGYLMSCMGAFLGLRCTARAFAYQGWARARWLLFAGVSIGITGIWAMHFIAMLGFTIPGETIHYNVPITILSMFIAVGIVCVGLLIVGFRGDGYRPLLLAGLITGLGVASMHYMGMAAMRMPGRIAYNPGLFGVSVVIAVVAATAALWAALRLRGVWPTLGAATVMGVAVSGMHYMGMAAMRMYRAPGPAGMVMGGSGGATAESFLLPLILGISVVSFISIATIALSPTDDEIRTESDLMDRIGKLGSHARLPGLAAGTGQWAAWATMTLRAAPAGCCSSTGFRPSRPGSARRCGAGSRASGPSTCRTLRPRCRPAWRPSGRCASSGARSWTCRGLRRCCPAPC